MNFDNDNSGNYNNNDGYYSRNKNYADTNNLSQLMVDNQMQSLNFSHVTLGNLLSAAENFAGLTNKKYESYNYSKSTDYNSLKSEFALKLQCFNLSIQEYEKKYGPYKFPMDYPKEKILKDIQLYMGKIQNNNDKMLYHMMADIINGKKVNNDFKKLYEELDENANHKFNIRKMNQIIGPLNQILDEVEKDAEIGNMNLFNRNIATKKANEKLKNSSKEYRKKLKVLIGEKGNLLYYEYGIYFISYKNKSIKVKINIDPLTLEENRLYKINKDILLVISINEIEISCELFINENIIEVEENNIIKRKNIFINNDKYNYGIFDDAKGNKYDILYKTD